MGGVGLGQLQALPCPLSRAVPNRLTLAPPAPQPCSALQARGDTAQGAHTTGGGSEHGLGGRVPPRQCPTLLPALFFLFFNLMLLWVLSCLYENKNNLRASAGAQPLPKALPKPPKMQ